MLVTEFFRAQALKLKNNAGLPLSVAVKSLCHRRVIFHTNCVPSPGAEIVQSSIAAGSPAAVAASFTPVIRTTARLPWPRTSTFSGRARRLS